jgi:hypothetical protein
MMWPRAASGKLRKSDLRVIGNRILDEGSYCWSDFCVVCKLARKDWDSSRIGFLKQLFCFTSYLSSRESYIAGLFLPSIVDSR